MMTVGLIFSPICRSQRLVFMNKIERKKPVTNLLKDYEDGGEMDLEIPEEPSRLSERHKQETEYFKIMKRMRGTKHHKPDGKIRMLKNYVLIHE